MAAGAAGMAAGMTVRIADSVGVAQPLALYQRERVG